MFIYGFHSARGLVCAGCAGQSTEQINRFRQRSCSGGLYCVSQFLKSPLVLSAVICLSLLVSLLTIRCSSIALLLASFRSREMHLERRPPGFSRRSLQYHFQRIWCCTLRGACVPDLLKSTASGPRRIMCRKICSLEVEAVQSTI